MKTYTFHVAGMHCRACPVLIESDLAELSEVKAAKAFLDSQSVEVAGDFADKSDEEVARGLTAILKPHGYSLSLEKRDHAAQWSDFKVALPIAVAFMALFLGLQKLGIVNLISVSNVSYGTAFFVGIIASLSTCMAIVGGLVLSMSATFSKEGDRVRPQLLFHIGRIVSFFVLGGFIGSIGSAFTLNILAVVILSVAIGVVMLILGLNLLDVFPWAKKFQPSMPKFLSKRALEISKLNHMLTPLLVGIATFFLPCGFTQSMQLYALTTGSFLTGGLTMLAFALGTLPILALVSLSTSAFAQSPKKGIFFKVAGLIVIMFSIFNIINGLVVAGFIPPVFSF